MHNDVYYNRKSRIYLRCVGITAQRSSYKQIFRISRKINAKIRKIRLQSERFGIQCSAYFTAFPVVFVFSILPQLLNSVEERVKENGVGIKRSTFRYWLKRLDGLSDGQEITLQK